MLQGTDCRCRGFSSCNIWASAIAAPGPGRTSSIVVAFQFSSVAQWCLTRCNPVDHSTPGLPVHHQLPASTQTHVHWVGNAIQPSHPLSPPSPPALPSFPASWSFPMSRLFTSGGQRIRALASMHFLAITLFLELYTWIFFPIHTTQQFAINIIVLPMLKLDFKKLLKNVRVTLYLQQSMGITEKLRLVRQVYLTNFCPINRLPWWLRPQNICLQWGRPVFNQDKVKVKVAQSRPTLCDPMDYADRGILQARILEWVGFPFSRGSSQPRDQAQVSHNCRQILYQLRHQGSPCLDNPCITRIWVGNHGLARKFIGISP